MKTKLLFGLCILGTLSNAFAGSFERPKDLDISLHTENIVFYPGVEERCQQVPEVTKKMVESAKLRGDLLDEWLKLFNKVSDLMDKNQTEEMAIYEAEMEELDKKMDAIREENAPYINFLKEMNYRVGGKVTLTFKAETSSKILISEGLFYKSSYFINPQFLVEGIGEIPMVGSFSNESLPLDALKEAIPGGGEITFSYELPENMMCGVRTPMPAGTKPLFSLDFKYHYENQNGEVSSDTFRVFVI